MKIKISGEMPLNGLMQAIFEVMKRIEEEHAIGFSRGATIYINPTDGNGRDVVLKDAFGEAVKSIQADGPYRSAAAEFKL